jgi:hypothetical protein
MATNIILKPSHACCVVLRPVACNPPSNTRRAIELSPTLTLLVATVIAMIALLEDNMFPHPFYLLQSGMEWHIFVTSAATSIPTLQDDEDLLTSSMLRPPADFNFVNISHQVRLFVRGPREVWSWFQTLLGHVQTFSASFPTVLCAECAHEPAANE